MVVFLLITRRVVEPPLAVGVARGRAAIVPSLAGIRLAGFLLSLRGLQRLGFLLGPVRLATRTFLMIRAEALRIRSRAGPEDCCPV